jgi:hypothetical protein
MPKMLCKNVFRKLLFGREIPKVISIKMDRPLVQILSGDWRPM